PRPQPISTLFPYTTLFRSGIGEPTRDWFPISFASTFGDWADLVHGPAADWGQLACGCHPNCGVGMALMIDKETREAAPVTAFLRDRKSTRLNSSHRTTSYA